jgi:hypothetical protein
MRGLGWQDAVVAALALAALAWLVRHRLRRRGAACEDCPARAMAVKMAARRQRTSTMVRLKLRAPTTTRQK